MGTRHLILVYYKGQYRIAQYGQWDGYPSGQGSTILKFIRNTENVEKLKLVLDDPDMLYEPSDEEMNRIYEGMEKAFSDHYNNRLTISKSASEEEQRAHMEARPWKDFAPSVSRDTGGEILEVVANTTKPLPLKKSINFLADKVMCEWVYVVDLDKATFEIFSSREMAGGGDMGEGKGMKDIGVPGQYRFDNEVEGLEDAKYFPPMVGQWSLAALPDDVDFVACIGYGDN